jgi:hypothetical protein
VQACLRASVDRRDLAVIALLYLAVGLLFTSLQAATML